MAAIIEDGPRAWAIDVLDHKLGRAIGLLTGAVMLAAVFVIDPGPARLAMAIGSVVMFLRSAQRARVDPAPADLLDRTRPRDVTADLAELEAVIIDMRAALHEREARLDGFAALLAGVSETVAVGADRLRKTS
jgi:hypothetical protein